MMHQETEDINNQFQAIIIDIPSLDPTSEAVEFQDQLQSINVNMQNSSSSQTTEKSIKSSKIQCQFLQAKSSGATTHEHKVNCYDFLKTRSAKFERQLSNAIVKPEETQEINDSQATLLEALPPVDRYFDALEGPELESLKDSEKLILPEDEKWPFLLRFPISTFGLSLGIGIQSLLWKTIAKAPSMSFLHVSPVVNFILWCISLSLMIMVAIMYSLKIIFYFEAVKREFFHPIRVNFFFAPWIGCILLAASVPSSVGENLNVAIWYVLMVPILCLELKIYGQWMLGGEHRLSKVANPSNHLSVVGNFAIALLGSSMGLKEGPVFFFAVGLVYYVVLFVTLYQRLPTNETLPKDLHPIFFLFIAGPSIACLSWTMIVGHFDLGSRMAYFLALFLYASLAVRINFFRGFRFSLAWWAYTIPMTSVSIATIKYTAEVDNHFTKILSIVLSFISALTVTALVITTILYAFVFHNLFPNDIAIAITVKRPKSRKKHSHNRTSSLNTIDSNSRIVESSAH